MITLNQFKTNHSFSQVASQFGYHFSPQKTNICPVCQKPSFSIFNNDTNYKCFRPSCDLNKSGDIFNFLQILGLSSGFKESLELLEIQSSYKSSNNSRTKNILDLVFEVYRQQFFESSRASDYLINRGYNPKKFEVGYAPPLVKFLSQQLYEHLPKLEEFNLIKSNGEDYFQDRIIFPIRDLNNNIVHFHTRDISNSPEIELRWMASKKRDTSNIDYLWRGHIEYKSSALFLTEGISDGLSLVNWDLPTVSTMSIQADIVKLFYPFNSLTELHCIFDNDRQAISNNKKSYTFKSWEYILPKLINLKISRPDLNIYCLMPPSKNGIKDLNDWSRQITKETFQHYYSKNTLSIEDFTLKHFFRPDYFKSLITLSKKNNSLKEKLVLKVEQNYTNWLDFIFDFN